MEDNDFSKLMYACGVMEWYKREYDNLEVIPNGFGRWLFIYLFISYT